MDQLPHPIVTAHADRTRQAQQRQHVIGRRGLMKLAAGAGVATMSVAGRGLILPWVDFGRAAAAAELVEPEVRASRDGLLDTTLTCSVQSVPLAGQHGDHECLRGLRPRPRHSAFARATGCGSTSSTRSMIFRRGCRTPVLSSARP